MINIRHNIKIIVGNIISICSCKVNLRKTLIELNLTGTNYTKLIYKLQEKFNINITNDIHFNTLEDIAFYLEKESKSVS